MISSARIIVLDPDAQRRAAICKDWSSRTFKVESYGDPETMAELPSEGILLVQDRHGLLDDVFASLEQGLRWLPCVGYQSNPDWKRVRDIMSRGAVGYLQWPFDPDEFEKAMLFAASQAQSFYSGNLRRTIARKRIETLSLRERQTFEGVVAGLSSREIAERYGISPRTVDVHRSKMLMRIGARRTYDAVRLAIEADVLIGEQDENADTQNGIAKSERTSGNLRKPAPHPSK